MSRRSRVPAAQCRASGWYKARNGRVIQIVKKPNSRWRCQRCTRADVPYRSPANPESNNPLWRVPSYGWLRPDYPLLPHRRPRWA